MIADKIHSLCAHTRGACVCVCPPLKVYPGGSDPKIKSQDGDVCPKTHKSVVGGFITTTNTVRVLVCVQRLRECAHFAHLFRGGFDVD